jgi:hypothetical protein
MKKIFTCLTLLVLFLGANAQETPTKNDLNCYNKWSLKFDERGADDVLDGVYTDIIITFRQGANAECYDGKAIVKDKKLDSFFILLEDGTYEQVIRVWKSESKALDIVNGISKPIITKDNQLVNVLWPKKIRPKKAAFKHAAEPTDD